jgi:two-component system, NarL family, nitrate/nitrite response regulator NarL
LRGDPGVEIALAIAPLAATADSRQHARHRDATEARVAKEAIHDLVAREERGMIDDGGSGHAIDCRERHADCEYAKGSTRYNLWYIARGRATDENADVNIRIILVDDHPIVLQGLQHLFERHDDFEVVACCPDADTAVAAVRAERPDVLVLDLRMPGRDGLAVLRTLNDEKIPCRTVLLTAAITEDQVLEAVKLGAAGLVLKESAPEMLLACVRRVHQGEQWIDRETVTRAFRAVLDREAAAKEASQTLTPREIEIVKMVAQGLRNRAIAERLSISEGTVKVHLHNIYEKYGVDGRLELVLVAQQKGLI